jgi:hypothetical protein
MNVEKCSALGEREVRVPIAGQEMFAVNAQFHKITYR